MWDVLCNIDTGKITIHKDIKTPSITSSASASTPGLVPRTGVVAAVADEDVNKVPPMQRDGTVARADFTARPDSGDNQFMEEVSMMAAYVTHTHRARLR
jgi:hypothetical protein